MVCDFISVRCFLHLLLVLVIVLQLLNGLLVMQYFNEVCLVLNSECCEAD